jgi:diguanylate cyclase (GGDEF)-like protein
VAGVVLPVALLAALVTVAVALLMSAGAHRAANRELDTRALTVKNAWGAAGGPTEKSELQRLGRRLHAQLRVVRGTHAQAGITSGDVRRYSFPARPPVSLRVALSTSASSDAISKGLVAGVIIGIAGVLLVAALLAAMLRSAAVAPLRALAAAAKGGARAPISGAREMRAASQAFNQVAEQAAQLDQRIGADTLTGLPSGPRVREAIAVEIKRSQREMAPMALVLFDIDNFKRVNDGHGKQAGDLLLRSIVEHVRPALRATDVFGRMGGDEFALILPSSSADHAEMVVARAREALVGVGLDGFEVSFSAGYACFPADGADVETLCQAAEGALKARSRSGTRRASATRSSP